MQENAYLVSRIPIRNMTGMKKFFLMAAFLLLGAWGTLFAQDIITLKNGEDLKAKILEVLSNEIKYKRYDNMDGPIFTLRKSEILMITYQNGTREVIKATSPADSGGKVYAYAPEDLRPGMKYKQLKEIYDISAWDGYRSGDTYRPANWCWNFLLTGLGQMVMEEGGRGAAFLGAQVGCGILAGIGSSLILSAAYMPDAGPGPDHNAYHVTAERQALAGTILSVVGSIGGLAVSVWSMVDAANVMKVKNMYGRDMRGIASNVEFRVAPWVGPAPGIDGNFRTSAGLALTMNF